MTEMRYSDKLDFCRFCKWFCLLFWFSVFTIVSKGEVIQMEQLPSVYEEETILSPDSLLKINDLLVNGSVRIRDSVIFKLGNVFRDQGNFNLSSFYFYKGLEMSEELGLDSLKARYFTNIGINHSRSGNFNKARYFYEQALNTYKKLGDSLRVSFLYNNISMQYFREQDYQNALKFYEESVRMKKNLGLSGIRLNPSNLGQIYHKMGNYEKAMEYHLLAIKYLEELENRNLPVEAMAYQFLGELYRDVENYQKALETFEKSLILAKKLNAKKEIEKTLGGFSSVYAALGKYKEAYEFGKEQKQYLDTLTMYSSQVSGLEAQYELGMQEKELALIKFQNEIALNKRDFIIFLVSGGFVLLLIIVFLISKNYKTNIRNSRLLQKKNDLLKEQKINQLLKEKEVRSMRSFIDGQEKERLRVARDLHDSLGGTLAILKIKLEQAENQDYTVHLNEVISEVDKVYEEVKTVAGNLAPPKFKSTYFTDVLSGYFQEVNHSDEIVFHVEFQPEESLNLLPEKVKIELYRIIQELVTNVLKHAAATTIDIQLLKHEGFVNLIVEDNGKGFNPQKKHKGMGVSNVKSRVSLLNGELDIDSEENRGTLFNIDIPVKD